MCIFYALRVPWNKYHDKNMEQTLVLSSTSSSNCNFDISKPDWWHLYLVSSSLWIYNTVYLIFISFIFAKVYSSLMIKYCVKIFTLYLPFLKQIWFDLHPLNRWILLRNFEVICWQSLITNQGLVCFIKIDIRHCC